MNMVQHEAGLIPSVVRRDAKAAYIQSLSDSAEAADSDAFVEFMLRHHVDNLKRQIEEFLESTQAALDGERVSLPRSFLETSAFVPQTCPVHARKTYIALTSHPAATNKELGALLGVSDRTVRAHIRDLKEAGLIVRVGSDRSGYWKVLHR